MHTIDNIAQSCGERHKKRSQNPKFVAFSSPVLCVFPSAKYLFNYPYINPGRHVDHHLQDYDGVCRGAPACAPAKKRLAAVTDG